jgi:hypothetical protein
MYRCSPGPATNKVPLAGRDNIDLHPVVVSIYGLSIPGWGAGDASGDGGRQIISLHINIRNFLKA